MLDYIFKLPTVVFFLSLFCLFVFLETLSCQRLTLHDRLTVILQTWSTAPDGGWVKTLQDAKYIVLTNFV